MGILDGKDYVFQGKYETDIKLARLDIILGKGLGLHSALTPTRVTRKFL